MTYTERARALRPYIVKASASLTDADAVKAKGLYDRWAAGMAVEVNDRLVYADRLYRVTQAHTTQEGWEPDKVPALFTWQRLWQLTARKASRHSPFTVMTFRMPMTHRFLPMLKKNCCALPAPV